MLLSSNGGVFVSETPMSWKELIRSLPSLEALFGDWIAPAHLPNELIRSQLPLKYLPLRRIKYIEFYYCHHNFIWLLNIAKRTFFLFLSFFFFVFSIKHLFLSSWADFAVLLKRNLTKEYKLLLSPSAQESKRFLFNVQYSPCIQNFSFLPLCQKALCWF